MLMATAASPDVAETVRVIDVITRLGLSYHFEEDIEFLLNQMFESGEATKVILHNHDLFTVAMMFRVFRQHGYEMSCDVFQKFKGGDGRFKETLSSDAMGLLSMYEAAFLSLPNEDILDEALEFSMLHLKSLIMSSNGNSPLEEVIVAPHLRSHIANALRMPIHKEIPRYGVHQFITYFDQESSKSGVQEESLLRFAKMDYNRLQNLYRHEVCECLR
ncbi:unnamed protein product [Cuscuta campestris]|uniref:5-epiaristolochene synthase n=1 Tax=Cuscuta campestris TaxID=132261 RepID=A0A484KJR6_9ASTE|nr:unnamed protein product [Cuscuta campestris]